MARGRWLWRLVAGIVLIGGAGALVWDREFGPEWHCVLWVSLDGTEAIEYGYVRSWDVRWGAPLFLCLFPTDVSRKVYWPVACAFANRRYELHWHRADGTRKYYVYEGDSDQASADLRCSPDVERLWVFDRTWGRILCSLDRVSGQFLSDRGLPMDWHLSPSAQLDYWNNREMHGMIQSHPPEAVADPQGGRLLASGDAYWDQ